MIKKTIKTLKEYPIILLAFMTTFLYVLISNTVLSGASLLDVINNNAQFTWQTGASTILFVLYYVGWIVFLYPPIMRYIYMIIAGKPTEGWYMRGLKSHWWRGIVVGLIIGAIGGAISAPFIFMVILIAVFSQAQTGGIYVIGAVTMLFVLIVSIFLNMGRASVFAEDDFGRGLAQIFKATMKTFWKVLPFVAIAGIPLVVQGVMSYNGVIGYSNIIMIAIALFSSIMGAFLSVYCMHCYLDFDEKAYGHKSHEFTKRETSTAVEDEQ